MTFPDSVTKQPTVLPSRVEASHMTNGQYRQLMIYLTSLVTQQDKSASFTLIFDRRLSGWATIKQDMANLAGFFPGNIEACYIIKPVSFIQRTLTDLRLRFHVDKLKHKVILCNNQFFLHTFVPVDHLTEDLGGRICYSPSKWMEERQEIERLALATHAVAYSLKLFASKLYDVEFTKNAAEAEKLWLKQRNTYSGLQNDLSLTIGTAVNLKNNMEYNAQACYRMQLAETHLNYLETTKILLQMYNANSMYDKLWQLYGDRLRKWHQINKYTDLILKCQEKLKQLLEKSAVFPSEFASFEDVRIYEKKFERFSDEFQLVKDYISDAKEIYRSLERDKPHELEEYKDSLTVVDVMYKKVAAKFDDYSVTLSRNSDIYEKLQQISTWCAEGVNLLSSQPIDTCSTQLEANRRAVEQIEHFMRLSARLLVTGCADTGSCSVALCSALDHMTAGVTPDTRQLVEQVRQRVTDVHTMCTQRCHMLRSCAQRLERPVLSVQPRASIRRSSQPTLMAPKEAEDLSGAPPADGGSRNSGFTACRNIIRETIETELLYVHELSQVITGYKEPLIKCQSETDFPSALVDKADVIFGNLEDILDFHQNQLLPVLQSTCHSSRELVGVFVTHKERIRQLYTQYCKQKPASENLLKEVGETEPFLQRCQLMLGHRLPLTSYLLKPIQRITKYRLLIGDLHKHNEDADEKLCIQAALDQIVFILNSINNTMHELLITNYPSDLNRLGELFLQSCLIVENKDKVLKELRPRQKQRHVFLYERMIVFCKRKEEFGILRYDYVSSLKTQSIGLTENVEDYENKFELWLTGRSEVYTLVTGSVQEKDDWVTNIKALLMSQLQNLKQQNKDIYNSKMCSLTIDIPDKVIEISQAKVSPSRKAKSCYMEATGTHSQMQPAAPTGVRNTMALIRTPYPVSGSGSAASEAGSSITDFLTESSDAWSECSGQRQIKYLIALTDYVASGCDSNELSFAKDGVFELLETGDLGWCYVRNVIDNNEGWAPLAFFADHNIPRTS